MSKRKPTESVSGPDDTTVFLNNLRRVLSLSAEVSEIPCREKEAKQLSSFFQKHLQKKTVGSMYVCGAPGTGKTAVLTKTLDDVASWAAAKKLPEPRVIFINGVSLETQGQGAIFQEIYRQLRNDYSQEFLKNQTTQEVISGLESKLIPYRKNKSSRPVFVVVDEIDALMNKQRHGKSGGGKAGVGSAGLSRSPLYRLFEWPSRKNSLVSVVGIANSVDLIQRLLPMLRVKGLEPQSIVFEPYNTSQITKILLSRIRLATRMTEVELGGGGEDDGRTAKRAKVGGGSSGAGGAAAGGTSAKVAAAVPFDDRALELTARKVAANSGDARDALDVFGQTIIRAMKTLKARQAKQAAAALAASTGGPGAGCSAGPAPRKNLVSLSHVSKSVKHSFGSKHVVSVRALPREAAVFLTSCVIHQRSKKKTAVSLMEFYSAYSGLKKRFKMEPVPFPVCSELVSRLEQSALVSMGKGHGRQRKLRLKVPYDDVEFALVSGSNDGTFYKRLFEMGNAVLTNATIARKTY
jgi:cell division control protein 6